MSLKKSISQFIYKINWKKFKIMYFKVLCFKQKSLPKKVVSFIHSANLGVFYGVGFMLAT